jgi:hypothetical protein
MKSIANFILLGDDVSSFNANISVGVVPEVAAFRSELVINPITISSSANCIGNLDGSELMLPPNV